MAFTRLEPSYMTQDPALRIPIGPVGDGQSEARVSKVRFGRIIRHGANGLPLNFRLFGIRLCTMTIPLRQGIKHVGAIRHDVAPA